MGYTTGLGLTPTFRIERGGDDITTTIADRLVTLRVASYSGGGAADTATITLDDRNWNIVLPSVGEDASTLSISMGYVEGSLYSVGTFQVDKLKLSFSPRTMTLECNSADMNSNLKAPLITSFDGQTVGDVVSAIASSAGVSAVVAPALAGLTVKYLNQHSGSGHLLQNLEGRFNALAKFSDGKLSFTERGSGQSASGQALDNVTLDGSDLADLEIDIDNRHSYSHVRASYWDVEQHKLIWIKSSVPGDTASSVPFMLKRAYNTDTEAQAAADAQMASLNRQGAQGSLTMAKGDPRIVGGASLTITGTRPGIDGSYVIDSAIHSLTKDGGLITTLRFASENGAGAQGGEDS